MPYIETVVDQPIETLRPESLDAYAMGDLVAAVGNHEGKALLQIAMQPGVGYGQGDVASLFVNMQGSDPAFVGNRGNAMDYCNTFEEVGLVTKSYLTGYGVMYELTERAPVGKAVAAAVLTATEGEFSPREADVFGQTALSGDGRPPMRTIALMRTILDAKAGEIIHKAEVAERAGLHPVSVGARLEQMAESGLVQYDAIKLVNDIPRYRVGHLPGNLALKTAVTARCAELLRASEGEEVSLHELYALFKDESGEISDSYKRPIISFTHFLAKRGFIHREGGRTLKDFSHILLTQEQREFWDKLISSLDEISLGDSKVIQHWIGVGNEILQDKDRVKAFIKRAFDKNARTSQNVTSHDEKTMAIQRVLTEQGNITTNEIVSRLKTLGFAIGKRTVGSTLTRMLREGQVQADAIEKSSIAYRWRAS